MTINSQPVIILVRPQLGENIGMCARAMLNCGLENLRLVAPRDGWPNAKAKAAAADADRVIDSLEVFDSVDAAVSDCHRVFATTARTRSVGVPVLGAEEASPIIRSEGDAGSTVAILFGPEASGLTNEDLVRADTLIRFPTNPDFSSLNLAQSVLLFGWEWKRGEDYEVEFEPGTAATRTELETLIRRFESLLEEAGFFLTPELKPSSLQTLRTILTRSMMSDREVQFLHGALTALVKKNE